jgi:hypothetical protein
VFHRFGQDKFAYGGSILKIEPIFAIAQATSKFNVQYKNSQK